MRETETDTGTDVQTLSPEREAELLKQFFDTVKFDRLPKGLPKIEDEEDDE